jgi:molybdate transport repressor ModE-like protein
MNTKSLRVFLEVARTGSFSTAARNLGLTQPAVSFHIQSLEKEYGSRLVDRSHGRCRLTDAGHSLSRYAHRILKAEEELVREMEGRRSEASGPLLVAASNIPGEYIMPRVLSLYRQRHPLVEPRLAVSDSERVLESVRGGEADLGCVGFREEDERLVYGDLCYDRLVFIASDRHPLAGEKRLEPGDLAGQTLVLREEGSGTRSHMLRILADLGLDAAGMDCMVLGSTMAVIQAVAAGAGISLSSLWAVEPYLRLGRLRVLKVKVRELRRDFHYVMLRRRPAGLAATALVDLIEEMRPALEETLASYREIAGR